MDIDWIIFIIWYVCGIGFYLFDLRYDMDVTYRHCVYSILIGVFGPLSLVLFLIRFMPTSINHILFTKREK